MKLHSVWFWETLENLPLLFGFVIAARLWRESLPLGVLALVFGMGLGVLVTRLVEPKLHKEKHEVRWMNMLINFLLFVGLAIPFIYYFRSENGWFNWTTDLLGGLVVGALLIFVQSLYWQGTKSRMLLHGGAMIVSVPVIMIGVRSVIRITNWGQALYLTFLLTLFASLIIALIDYREMYE